MLGMSSISQHYDVSSYHSLKLVYHIGDDQIDEIAGNISEQQQQQICPQAGESARVSRDVLEIRLFTPAQSLLSRTPAVSRYSHRTPRLFFSIWPSFRCALERLHLYSRHHWASSSIPAVVSCCLPPFLCFFLLFPSTSLSLV